MVGKWNIQESSKINIKRLIRENTTLNVTDETNDTTTYNISYNGRHVGQLGIGNIKEMDNTIELVHISIEPREEFHSMNIISSVITSIWQTLPDIQRILMTPKPESKTFWYKMGATRLNDDFLMINRGR
jgi:hypothetical protein